MTACQFKIEETGETGFNTGRPRYKVECLTCRVVCHPGTTGPVWNVNYHLSEVARGVQATLPPDSSHAVDLSAARVAQIAADTHKEGTVGEARSLAREVVRHRTHATLPATFKEDVMHLERIAGLYLNDMMRKTAGEHAMASGILWLSAKLAQAERQVDEAAHRENQKLTESDAFRAGFVSGLQAAGNPRHPLRALVAGWGSLESYLAVYGSAVAQPLVNAMAKIIEICTVEDVADCGPSGRQNVQRILDLCRVTVPEPVRPAVDTLRDLVAAARDLTFIVRGTVHAAEHLRAPHIASRTEEVAGRYEAYAATVNAHG